MDELYPREFDARRILPLVPGIFPKEMVWCDSVIPIGYETDGRLIVGVLETCDDEIFDKVQFVCNRELKVVVVSEEAMAYAVRRYVFLGKPDFTGDTAEAYLRWCRDAKRPPDRP